MGFFFYKVELMKIIIFRKVKYGIGYRDLGYVVRIFIILLYVLSLYIVCLLNMIDYICIL